ncbi:MAG: hypothetical protein ACLP1Y_16640 [Candidatus Acidiferrales bacterium]
MPGRVTRDEAPVRAAMQWLVNEYITDNVLVLRQDYLITRATNI